ncbi:MAG: threonine--tRNA ligase, partial [Clostridia bacterium]|nr:threonine--tRNA ligase [Clostridia bacterium]
LTYTDKDNIERTPVVIHRAILGSLDRFMAYLIEETMGAFPTWLAPVQVQILPITDRAKEYGESILAALKEKGVRAEIDNRNEKIGYKIREHKIQKVPYLVIIGDNEVANGTITVNSYKKGDLGNSTLDAFLEMLTEEITKRLR